MGFIKCRVRTWLVVAMLICLVVELTLLGVLPNVLPSDPSSWIPGLSDPSTADSQDSTRHRSPNEKHRSPNAQHLSPKPGISYSPKTQRPNAPSRRSSPALGGSPSKRTPHKRFSNPDFRTIVYPRSPGADPEKVDHSLEYLMKGATSKRQTDAIYMDDRISRISPRWGWETRCMPGFGRTAFSLPSVNFLNFSVSANFSNLPENVHNYRFLKTIYSHKPGEHLRIGIDVGLSIWSIIPILNEEGSITHISVIATPPIRPRDRPMLPDLKSQHCSSQNGTQTPSSTQKSKGYVDKSVWVDSKFRFVLYSASGTEITLPVEKTVLSSPNLVILTCPVAEAHQQEIKMAVTSENPTSTLALHDLDLNLYWNFSTPCLPRNLKETEGEVASKTVIMTSSMWKAVERPIKHDLTAVLIVRNETLNFVGEWLTNLKFLGFDHVYVYKQQRLSELLDKVDEILLEYVKKRFVTVQPFFDLQPGCDLIQDFNTNHCEAATIGYWTLLQDAVLRFPSAWMMLADSNEMLIVPSATNTFDNGSLSTHFPKDLKSHILKTLQRSLSITGSRNGTLAISLFPFGTGPKSIPSSDFLKDGSLAMEKMNWRAEYPEKAKRFFTTGGFPNLVSNSIGRIDPLDIRIHSYLLQYKGALLENNRLHDNSTAAWASHIRSRMTP